jgi:intracellular sulfur oxidation DsrE/DsrF family protein
MKRFNLLLATLLLALPLVSGNLLAEGYGKQKVVYHINYDNPQQQAGALGNIQNHINAVGAENLELKVVLHGNGLSLLTYPEALGNTKLKHANADDQMQAKIDGLKSQGVGFQVCANTLKGKKINLENDLYNTDKADVVPSGVAQLAHLQAQGYTYIKP